MTKTKLSWRLKTLPTPDELRELVKDKIITQEEARSILFSSETESERDAESLKSEIKFLRELVEKLAKGNTQIVETIRHVEKPYRVYPWYTFYGTWCDILSNASSTTQQIYSVTPTFTSINNF